MRSQQHRSLHHRVIVVLCLTLIWPAANATTAFSRVAAQSAPRTVAITGNDDMKFSVTAITARPGERLRIQLKNTGTMPKAVMGHNFVLLKAGIDPDAFTTAGADASETDYITPAQKSQILAATKMVGPGETAEVTFTAPDKPGPYPFVCTFPGHSASGMKGTLVVK